MDIESVFKGSPSAESRVVHIFEANKITSKEKLLSMDWPFHLLLACMGEYKLMGEAYAIRRSRFTSIKNR